MTQTPLEQYSILVKPGERIPAAALAALGPYTKGGTTANFDIYYDNSLGTNGQTLADAVLADCEQDFAQLQAWFGGIAAGRFTVYIDPGSFGAYHANCGATEIHCAAFSGTNGALENMLNVAEVDEVMMANQNAGWNCGASNGEGLSRVLATERYPAELNGFASANSWLNSNRPDFVTNNDPTDRDYVSIGCSTLFLNYLRYQLGFSWNQIITAGGSTLSSVYKNLTGDPSDPFPPFKDLLDTYYPGTTTIPGTSSDNPFPLGSYRRLPQRTGDLDGDGVDEIVISSPWGIGVLEQTGGTMNALMLAPNGTRFGGWLLNTADNRFGPLADYNGDGRAEVFVSSPWGLGFLELSGATLTSTGMTANGTAIGGWTLNTAANQFGPAADYDGDGTVEFFVSSVSGLGLLKLSGGALSALLVAPNGTRFGGWLLNTADNQFGPAADYDGDGQAEVFVTSPWGVGILKLSGGALSAIMLQPNGTRFGGWLLNTADNTFGPAADYDGDGQAEVFVTSPWGVGILKLEGGTMNALMLQPNGTRFGGWLLNTADNQFGPAANYDDGTAADVFVTSPWGVGILKLAGGTMSAPMMQPNGTRFGGWLLNTADNHFMAAGHFAGGAAPAVLVTSPWGIGLLEQTGSTMNAPMLQPNGTRFGGWLLNTADNTL